MRAAISHSLLDTLAFTRNALTVAIYLNLFHLRHLFVRYDLFLSLNCRVANVLRSADTIHREARSTDNEQE